MVRYRWLRLVVALVLGASLLMPAVARANPEDGGNGNNNQNGQQGQHGGGNGNNDGNKGNNNQNGEDQATYGPYASGSGDSGTCGPDWANDTFDRVFTIDRHSDGTFTVREDFRNGSFVTIAGPSPAACDPTYSQHGTLVNAGVTGKMHGYFIIPLPPGTAQTSTSPYCDAVLMTNANCTTATFVNTHFSPACYPATCPVTSFFFQYQARGQGLIYRRWQNASPDLGGNKGDIANS